MAPEKYASAADASEWLRQLFTQFGPDELLKMLDGMGLLTYSTADGWYYPVSESAQTVAAAFASALDRAGVKLLMEHKVTAIRKSTEGFTLTFEDRSELTCEKLLVAAGGKAYPTLGSRGECFPFLKALGHTVRPLLPALGPLSCEMKHYQKLRGVRLDAKVTLYAVERANSSSPLPKSELLSNMRSSKVGARYAVPLRSDPSSDSLSKAMPLHGNSGDTQTSNLDAKVSRDDVKRANSSSRLQDDLDQGRMDAKARHAVPLRPDMILAENTGNLIFTQWGLNGPAVMDLSHLVARNPGAKLELRLNFLPYHEEAVRAQIKAHRKEEVPLAVVPCSSLPPKLAQFLLAQAGLKGETALKQCSDSQLETLMEWITEFPVEVTGVRDFDTCQVTAGGVPVGEVDPLTMQSRLVPGLYLAGETLDVVGPCGGYNLQFAFSTGAVAGMGLGN